MTFQAEDSLGYLWKASEMKALETDVVDSDIECWLGERFTLPCKRARHKRYGGRVQDEQDIRQIKSERTLKEKESLILLREMDIVSLYVTSPRTESSSTKIFHCVEGMSECRASGSIL